MSNVCPFCDESQSYRYVLEGTHVRSIYPLRPACAYHILVTPKRHVLLLSDLNDQEWQEVQSILQLFHQACSSQIDDYIGYNVLSNNGDKRINQQVPHAHLHVFLRTDSDGVDPIRAPHTKIQPTLNEIDLRHLTVLQNIVQSDISPLQ